MNNFLLNEGYENLNNLFTSGKGSKIYINNKKFLDLSLCAGTHLLGHNPKIFQKSVKDLAKLRISNFLQKTFTQWSFQKHLRKFYHIFQNLFSVILALRL